MNPAKKLLAAGLVSLLAATGVSAPERRIARYAPTIEIGLNDDSNVCDFGPAEGPCGAGPSSFGIVKDAGVTWIRYGIFWSNVNPKPGVYNWARTDAQIKAILDAGFQINLGLIAPPAYAIKGPVPDCVENYKNLDGSLAVRYRSNLEECRNLPPVDVDALQDIIKVVFTRYKGKIHFLNPTNEADYAGIESFGTWTQQPDGTWQYHADYRRLITERIIPMRDAARSVDPTVEVVGPDIDEEGNLEEFFKAEQETGLVCDKVTFHDYAWDPPYPDGAIKRLPRFLEIMNAYAAGREIWITETGALSNPRVPGTMRFQAEAVLGFLEEVERHPEVRKIFFYHFKGEDATDYNWVFEQHWEDGKGLNVLVKPVVYALREHMTGQLFPAQHVAAPGRHRAVRSSTEIPDAAFNPVAKKYVTWDPDLGIYH